MLGGARFGQAGRALEMDALGLIAGNGRLPFALAQAARAAGFHVVAVAHRGETDPALEGHVDRLTWVRVGQLRRTASALQVAGVTKALFAGGIRKVRYFSGARPDLAALRLLATLRGRGDDGLLRAIARWFEAEGIEIVAPHGFLPGCFAPEGAIAGPEPRPAAIADAMEGLRVARILGQADVGQTVVIREGSIVAVEAMEGTDACISRAGEMAAGTVVVKACKPGQDRRFDLPAIGPATVEVLARARAVLLAVEAGTTLLLDRDELVRAANRAGVSIIGISG
ncbi:MAG: LpxI family protein [Deltaproteobacteria bacterium]